MRIDDDDLLHLERLARLRLTDEERALLRGDLERVLTHLGALAGIDTGDAQPMLRPVEATRATRDDDVLPSLPRSEVLRQGVADPDGFLRVARTGGDD